MFHFVFPAGCCEVHEGIVVVYDETGKLLLVYFLVNIYKLNLLNVALMCDSLQYLTVLWY